MLRPWRFTLIEKITASACIEELYTIENVMDIAGILTYWELINEKMLMVEHLKYGRNGQSIKCVT